MLQLHACFKDVLMFTLVKLFILRMQCLLIVGQLWHFDFKKSFHINWSRMYHKGNTTLKSARLLHMSELLIVREKCLRCNI